MEDHSVSPAEQLRILQEQYRQVVLNQVQLEAKLIALDQVVGHFMATGQPPVPEQLAMFWAKAAEVLKTKYPGVQIQTTQPKPALFIPTNGQVHKVR